MTFRTSLRLTERMRDVLWGHLFADAGEHAAVLGASVVTTENGIRFLGRKLLLAREGRDYIIGDSGHHQMTAEFVRDAALQCAGENLAFFSIHNHGKHGNSVDFSQVDLDTHANAHPALLDILNGPPVGALVCTTNAVAGKIWYSSADRRNLDETVVVGHQQKFLYPSPPRFTTADISYDRQVRIFGEEGQRLLRKQKIGIVGLGGDGSLINQYLAHLGIGHIVSIDDDILDATNMSRVVGSQMFSKSLESPGLLKRIKRKFAGEPKPYKVRIAKKVAKDINPYMEYEAVTDNVSRASAVERLLDCDAIFLAADSMTARIVVNAICHQYLIPVWQVGAKIETDVNTGEIQQIYSVLRELSPGETCLDCNGLIDKSILAEEASPAFVREAGYAENVPDPSVITLNAVVSGHAVNEYLFSLIHPLIGISTFSPAVTESPEFKWQEFVPRSNRIVAKIPATSQPACLCLNHLGSASANPLPSVN